MSHNGLTQEEIIKVPGQIRYLLVLAQFLNESKGSPHPKYPNVILLDSYISNTFTIGREDTSLEPFIGIQEKFTPYFFENDWNNAYLCPKEGYLYLLAGDEENILDAMILGIKIRKKRMQILWIEDLDENEERILSFRAFKVINSDEYKVSKKIYKTTSFKKINTIDELYKDVEIEEENEDEDNNDFLSVNIKK